MERQKINFKSMPWNMPAPSVRFKAFKQNRKQIRLVEFTKEFIESDWCTKGHIGFILEGEMEINFNGAFIIFKQGDGLFIPAGEKNKHMARVLTEYVRLILMEDV
jgi:ethanolamine utilization protein EutQ (cupin superfamily)